MSSTKSYVRFVDVLALFKLYAVKQSIVLVLNVNYFYLGFQRSIFVQEGFLRLWRGTNASLALAVPTVSHGLSPSLYLLLHSMPTHWVNARYCLHFQMLCC